MSLPLTPEMLAAAYDFLRCTPPFKGWKLPHSDAVEFKLTRHHEEAGHYNRYVRTNEHWIAISTVCVGRTESLCRYMCHEMIHLKQGIAKTETKGTVHNAEFRQLARAVCRLHGWDPKLFV